MAIVEQTFYDFLGASNEPYMKVTLVAFWDKSNPEAYKMIEPILEEVSEEVSNITFTQVSFERQEEIGKVTLLRDMDIRTGMYGSEYIYNNEQDLKNNDPLILRIYFNRDIINEKVGICTKEELLEFLGESQRNKSNILELTTQNFEEKVIQAKGSVLVAFIDKNLPAVGKVMEPILEKLSQEIQGVTIAKFEFNYDDTDDFQEKYVCYSNQFSLFRNGKYISYHLFCTKDEIPEFLESNSLDTLHVLMDIKFINEGDESFNDAGMPRPYGEIYIEKNDELGIHEDILVWQEKYSSKLTPLLSHRFRTVMVCTNSEINSLTFYGDVKEYDEYSANDILAYPENKVSGSPNQTIKLSGEDDKSYVTITYTVKEGVWW
ncbi:thioredoxin family protein (plasmid) [Bacillus mycoides]|uniref:thioredoxin family protein n=1 Tax=Bacillus mycoides TaxID=1405 RepID=UPI003F756E2C